MAQVEKRPLKKAPEEKLPTMEVTTEEKKSVKKKATVKKAAKKPAAKSAKGKTAKKVAVKKPAVKKATKVSPPKKKRATGAADPAASRIKALKNYRTKRLSMDPKQRALHNIDFLGRLIESAVKNYGKVSESAHDTLVEAGKQIKATRSALAKCAVSSFGSKRSKAKTKKTTAPVETNSTPSTSAEAVN